MKGQIRVIPNREIDRDKWDRGISNTLNRRIYAMSFFLDIFSPRWDAMIMDDGKAFMPVTRNRKYGVSYVFQPLFVQQLGCFFVDESYSQALPVFIEKIASSYSFIDISLNESNLLSHSGYYVKDMDNYLLNLEDTYDNIIKKYTQNASRNIKRAAGAKSIFVKDSSPGELTDVFISSRSGKYPGIKAENYKRLKLALEMGLTDGLIEIQAVRSETGNLLAAACFLKDFDRHVFYFSVNTDEGRKQGAMFSIVDNFIRHHAGTSMLLDMNGSMDSGTARFYKGFGADKVIYRRLTVNNLAFPLNLVKACRSCLQKK